MVDTSRGLNMRFAVIGVGAVGGYFGARLVQAGEDVVFIARGDTLRALQSEGIRLDSINGDLVLPSVNAVDDTALAGVVDVVLVSVKTWQVPEVASLIPGAGFCVLPEVGRYSHFEAPDQYNQIVDEFISRHLQ